MKKLLILMFSFIAWNITAKEQMVTEKNTVLEDIRYVSPEATETYIVWGINNWHLPPQSQWPEGSFVKNGKLYSPMKQKAFGFSSLLKVRSNTLINYVFWISHGPAGRAVDIWDVNIAPHNEYQLLANDNNVLLINAKVKVRPLTSLSILDVALPLLSFCTTLFFLFLIIRAHRHGCIAFEQGPLKVIASSAIILASLLIVIRSTITGQSWDLYLHPVASFPRILWAGFYDILFVMILSALFVLLVRVSIRQEMRVLISRVFVAISFAILIMAILWADPRSASELTSGNVISIAMICLSGFLSGIMCLMTADQMVRKMKMKKILLSSLFCACITYVAVAPFAIKNYNWEFTGLANPVIASVTNIHLPDSALFAFERPGPAPAILSPEVSNLLSVVEVTSPAGCVRICSSVLKETVRLTKKTVQ